jgi:hypothetical protein
MAEKIKLVRNDQRPQLVLSLTDNNDGEPIDVSDSTTTVRMKFRARGEQTLKDTLTAIKLPGVVSADGTIDYTNLTPGKGGRCYFMWGSTTLNGEAGDYEGEIEITFADGVQTVYDILKFKLRQDF